MTFLHPLLATLAVAAVSLPIVIHLLMHRRRKPVMWGAMRFLLEAYRRQRRRLMLEKWLLLAARCLLVLLAGLAIARPIVGAGLAAGLIGGGGAGKTVYLLIDNGIASGLAGPDGKTALEHHKEAAYELLDALHAAGGEGESDRVGLITLGAPAEAVVMPASVDSRAVRELIESITPSDSRTDLGGGVAVLRRHLSPEGGDGRAGERVFAAVLSDFREGSLDAAAAQAALPPGVHVIATPPGGSGGAQGGDEASNVGIVSIEPMRGVVVDPALASAIGGEQAGASGANAGEQQARVTLRRSGAAVGTAGATGVRAELLAVPRGGGGRGSAQIRVAAGEGQARWTAGQEVASVVVRLESANAAGASGGAGAGAWTLTASIDADDLPADNHAATTLDVRESVRVGIVAPTRFSGDAAALGGLGAADQLSAGAWVRLALSPIAYRGDGRGGGGEIEIAEIEPASLDAARLSDLDAVVIARPDLVPASAWGVLKLMVDHGGLVVVMPPTQATVHLWADEMIRAFGLSWTLAREASVYKEDGATSGATGWSVAMGAGEVRRSGAEGADAVEERGGTRAGAASENGGVLRLIRGELPELLPSVHVMKMLPMQGDVSRGEVVLSVTGSAGPTPLVWAGRPGEAARETSGNEDAGASDAEAARDAAADERGSRGLIVYLAASMDLSWTDLPAKPLMVPLMQEIVRQGLGDARGRAWWMAGVVPPPPAPAQSVELVLDAEKAADNRGGAAGGEQRSIGVTDRGVAAEPIRTGGVWRAVDGRGVVRGVVAVNADAAGAVVTPQGEEAVAAALGGADRTRDAAGGVIWLAHAAESVSEASSGQGGTCGVEASAIFADREERSPLARPLLIAALVLALVETLLARRASHAATGGRSETGGFARMSLAKEAA